MIERRRRDFLSKAGRAGLALGLLPPQLQAAACGPGAAPLRGRVVIARDAALLHGAPKEHGALVQKLLDAAAIKLTGSRDAASAWQCLFHPGERIGLKVNSLGLPTQAIVAQAIAERLVSAGFAPGDVLIWDRLDVELERAGYRVRRSGSGVRCHGTDVDGMGRGYDTDLAVSGAVGSLYSKIVTQKVDALISVPVLKDHNLAGVSLGLKNFYGAIHNPNKYHDNNCDPYVADVVAHPHIARKWRLTVCDATRAQYHAGPGRVPHYGWSFGGLLVSGDPVAADAIGAELIEAKRKEAGLRALAEEGRPPRHILTAASRGLGEGDPSKIERIEV